MYSHPPLPGLCQPAPYRLSLARVTITRILANRMTLGDWRGEAWSCPSTGLLAVAPHGCGTSYCTDGTDRASGGCRSQVNTDCRVQTSRLVGGGQRDVSCDALMAVMVHIVVSGWHRTVRNRGPDVSEQHTASVFWIKNRSATFLRIVRNHLPDSTV